MKMIKWENRPIEIANLINPSFCAFLIHEMIKGYEEKAENDYGLSYELLFLALPILLHKPTKEKLPRSISTYMHTWLQSNPEVRIGYAKRAKDLVPYTKEAIQFLTARDLLRINEDGSLSTSSKKLRLNLVREVNEYLTDYQKKAKLLGKWFAITGTNSTIYTMWGISP
jgi:Family of unknown function (DUF6521)